jgi:2-aminoadipate transaminase
MISPKQEEVSSQIQRALELYFKNNKWDEHIHYMQEIYRGKYEYILQKLEALKEYGIEFKKPNGGLYFWIRLSENISAYELYEKCYKEGLLILPSSLFCNDFDPNKDRYIRLSFASASIDDIQKGIDILQECIVKISAK